MMRRRCAVAAALLVSSSTANAAPLNTWGEHIGTGTFALTPYLYAGPSFGLESLTYLEYGVADSFEMAGAVDATVAPGQSLDGIELMPRWFFDARNALSLRMRWSPASPTDVVVGPEFHGVYDLAPVTLTLNAIWTPVVGSSGASPGTLGAIVAPEYFVNDGCSAFVEFSPTYDLAAPAGTFVDRMSFEVLPGMSFAIGDMHSFSVGVGFPVLHFAPENIYVGGWYSLAVGGA